MTKVEQKMMCGLTRTRFDFDDIALTYTFIENGKTTGFIMPYEYIGFDKKVVGISYPSFISDFVVAILIGMFAGIVPVLDVLVRMKGGIPLPLEILFIIAVAAGGTGILQALSGNSTGKKMTLIQLTQGIATVGVMHGPAHDGIVAEIESRRNARLMAVLGVRNPYANASSQYGKFKWLKQHGVVTEAQFQAMTDGLPRISEQGEG